MTDETEADKLRREIASHDNAAASCIRASEASSRVDEALEFRGEALAHDVAADRLRARLAKLEAGR